MCLLSINNLAFGSRVYSGRTLVTSFLRGSFMPMDFRAFAWCGPFLLAAFGLLIGGRAAQNYAFFPNRLFDRGDGLKEKK